MVPLVFHPNDDVIREVLAFLKAILYSGNLTVQQGMQHLLNTQDEKLFAIIRALLQNAATAHRERSVYFCAIDLAISQIHCINYRQALLLQVKEREDQDIAFVRYGYHLMLPCSQVLP